MLPANRTAQVIEEKRHILSMFTTVFSSVIVPSLIYGFWYKSSMPQYSNPTQPKKGEIWGRGMKDFIHPQHTLSK